MAVWPSSSSQRSTAVWPEYDSLGLFFLCGGGGGGGGEAQSVKRATPGEEILGSIPAMDVRSLLVGSVTG